MFLWEWNAQLFREAKGRLKAHNITIVTIFSLIAQGLLYLSFRSLLPPLFVKKFVSSDNYPRNKYCLGSLPDNYHPEASRYHDPLCQTDALGNVPINWQLWWFDLFITFSVISIILLTVVGVYLLIADLSKEERRGTLDFIRLSPQSPSSILIGKILGVPILLYWFVLLAIPLQLSAALQSGIPLSLLLAFYLVLGIGCSCLYSASLLFALANRDSGRVRVWLISAAVLLFVAIFTKFILTGEGITHTVSDWLFFLYPGSVLPYLIEATELDYAKFSVQPLTTISWFGQSLWLNTTVGISFIVANFVLLNYWIWVGLENCFHNALMGVWNKSQTYWLLRSINLVVLGFVFQVNHWSLSGQFLIVNFTFFLWFEVILSFVLVVGLKPR